MKKLWSGGLIAMIAGTGLAATPDAAQPVNRFAQRLHAQLAAGGGNVFYSPASIHLAFAMVTAGAAGTTEQELCDALALPVATADRRETMRRVASLCAQPKGVTLDVANRVWVARDLKVLPSYGQMLEQDFAAGFSAADFSTGLEKTRGEINGWVGERTRQMIPELLPPGVLTPQSRMVLVNAIYFLGQWVTPFPTQRTHNAEFKSDEGVGTPTRFMETTLDDARYAETPAAQWLALPYAGGEYEMVLMLPREGRLADMEKTWAEQGIPSANPAARATKVHVTMPRFKVRSQFALGRTMAALGARTAFTDQADFSGISGDKSLQISEAIHEAVCDVTEKGTEAAAATAVVMRMTSVARPRPPVEFKADHPFAYAIVHRPSGLILFLGRYATPAN